LGPTLVPLGQYGAGVVIGSHSPEGVGRSLVPQTLIHFLLGPTLVPLGQYIGTGSGGGGGGFGVVICSQPPDGVGRSPNRQIWMHCPLGLKRCPGPQSGCGGMIGGWGGTTGGRGGVMVIHPPYGPCCWPGGHFITSQPPEGVGRVPVGQEFLIGSHRPKFPTYCPGGHVGVGRGVGDVSKLFLSLRLV